MAIILAFSSCRKDTLVTETTISTPIPDISSYDPPVEIVTAGVIGFVVDENDEPVKEAIITLQQHLSILH